MRVMNKVAHGAHPTDPQILGSIDPKHPGPSTRGPKGSAQGPSFAFYGALGQRRSVATRTGFLTFAFQRLSSLVKNISGGCVQPGFDNLLKQPHRIDRSCFPFSIPLFFFPSLLSA